MNRAEQYRLFHCFYPPPYAGPEEQFFRLLGRYLQPGCRVLDAGCGDGSAWQYSGGREGQIGYLVGVDNNYWSFRSNSIVHARVQADVVCLPFAPASFDVVVCRAVLEHLPEPRLAFAEFRRVLTGEGRAVIHVPNCWHYAQWAARLTPLWFHRLLVRYLFGRDSHEKHYGANSWRKLLRLSTAVDMEPVERVMFESAPDYLAIAAPLYLIGVAIERLLNATERLAGLRLNIMAVFRPRRLS